jgi:hypothetical protein
MANPANFRYFRGLAIGPLRNQSHSWFQKLCSNKPHYFSLEETLYRYGARYFVNYLNGQIETQGIDLIFIEPGLREALSADIVKKINPRPIRLLMNLDVYLAYEQTLMLAAVCDLTLLPDPVSCIHFESLGLEISLFAVEANESIYKPLNLAKDFDIVFSGELKKERRWEFIEELQDLVETKNFHLIDTSYGLSEIEYNRLLNRSKLSLNLSRTAAGRRPLQHAIGTYAGVSLRGMKGRVLQSVLAGCALVSERFPGDRTMFPGLLTFTTPEEAARHCTYLLNHEEHRTQYASRLRSQGIKNYCESALLSEIFLKLQSLKSKSSQSRREVILNKNWSTLSHLRAAQSRNTFHGRPQIILAEFYWGLSQERLALTRLVLGFFGALSSLLGMLENRFRAVYRKLTPPITQTKIRQYRINR